MWRSSYIVIEIKTESKERKSYLNIKYKFYFSLYTEIKDDSQYTYKNKGKKEVM